MQIFKPVGKSTDDCFGIFLTSPAILLFLEVSVERDAIEVLHDDVQMVICLHHI